MAITVDWIDEEHTILCYMASGKWTWEEYYEARDRARELVDASADGMIDTIIDIRESSLMPAGALTHFRSMSQRAHTRISMGEAVVVGDHPFVRSMMTIMRKISGERMEKFHMAATLEQALEILDRRREMRMQDA